MQGQRLSLDPPGDPTLAECLLDDLSGPLAHRFGTMRDLVIGVTVVLPDGMRASSGGKVVKNVAGYDLAKLFCGSRGRLGSVERLALRLHPLPAAARTAVARRRLAGPPQVTALAECGRYRRRTHARALRGLCGCSRHAAACSRWRGGRAMGGAAHVAGPLARARALGRTGRRSSCGRGLGSPTSKRCASRSGARSRSASWSRCAVRADRRLRPLRLLPADLSDVFALERGDGFATRADLSDAGTRRRIDRTDRHGRRALRPLSRLHGLRDGVSVRCAVRPVDRADARLRRGSPPPHAARASRARRHLLGLPPPAAAACCASLPQTACSWAFRAVEADRAALDCSGVAARALAGRRPEGRADGWVRRERRLRRRQRRDRACAARGGVRRARAARASVLRRAARARRTPRGRDCGRRKCLRVRSTGTTTS